MVTTFAIVGASYGGLTTAHKLLKHVYPKNKDIKVIIISETTHWYWNIAAVRGVIPGLVSEENLFREIEPNLKKYPAESYEFVLGKAEKLDTAANTIEVSTKAGSRTINYDYVILATGTSYDNGLPLKTIDSYENTKEKLEALQAKVSKASSIILAGAGAAGTEMIVELGENLGKDKKITWVIAEDKPLAAVRNDLGGPAESKAKSVGITILTGSRVASATQVGEQTEVTLANGEKLTADLYLPITGMTPNSSYIPKALLDDKGYVKVTDHLRAVDVPNVYAIGDVSNREANWAVALTFQFAYIQGELEARLAGKDGTAKGYGGPPISMALISLGKKAGTGMLGWFKAPSFLVTRMKSTTLLTEGITDYIGGIKSSAGNI